MSVEHHHRRIHRRARVIHWGLAPLTLLIVPAWIYMSYGLCEDTVAPGADATCSLLRGMPFIPVLLGVVLLILIVRDLVLAHGEEHFARHGVRPERELGHAVHGWRSLGHEHRRHVRWAVAQVIAVAAGVALWLCWTVYRTTH